MNHFAVIMLFSAGLLLAACSSEPQRLPYPAAKKSDAVSTYHGIRVPDPYRWMENEDDPELKEWIGKQNLITRDFLAQVGAMSSIRSRLTELYNYPRVSLPFKKGAFYFFSKNDGLQNQSVLYRTDSLEGTPTPILDPNTWSDDGTIALTGSYPSDDGTMLVYGISRSGSDWQDLAVADLATGGQLSDTLRFAKFAGVAWNRDKRGFYYNRFPDPSTVPADQQSLNNKVYFHSLGTEQEKDSLVYERPDKPTWAFSPFSTDDGEYVLLHVWEGTKIENRIYYKRMDGAGRFVRLLDAGDASYDFVDNVGTVFYFMTDLDAPNKRVIAIDIANPSRRAWRTIIPELREPLHFITCVNNHFVAAYLKDAKHIIRLYDMRGRFVREIKLPSIGTVSGLSGKRTESDLFIGFTSFTFPTTNYRYDFLSDSLAVFYKPELNYEIGAYVTDQVFYTSKDGTKIPMFIVHSKNTKFDGKNPVILNGYGGFDISLTPWFSPSVIFWLEEGGVYAVPNLRGGGEYGKTWHEAGMREKKQNVFDDFIAAADWLIANNYTSSQRLAIEGGSNGGLLVAACMTQRPDLFGAVLCHVPLTDMLRYHKFTVGRYWIGEYGNAEENEKDFKFLYAYSPLHNVHGGRIYPPTLILTADHDDRVVPAHAFKFAAILQEEDGGTNPILLRVETRAGHGGGKPITKVIDQQTDIYSFLFKVFELGR